MRVIKLDYVYSKRMLATYMRRMRNNLEIRIAGSSCRCAISKWNLSLNLNVKFNTFRKDK